MLLSPMINNPLPLYNFLRDGHKINFFEVFIALTLFAEKAEYDTRIRLIFKAFDADGSESLDRRETA